MGRTVPPVRDPDGAPELDRRGVGMNVLPFAVLEFTHLARLVQPTHLLILQKQQLVSLLG